MKPLKEKKCKECSNKFTPQRPLQYLCSIECSIKDARKKQKQKEKKADKVVKDKLLSQKDYLKMLQTQINVIVRNIDTNATCISSGRIGCQFHAGHFHTVGGKPSLRFHLFNIWKQSAQDNNFKSGNIQDYIMNLNILFGSEWVHENVINLPYKYPVLKLSIPELIEKIAICKQILKEQRLGNHIALSTEDRVNIRNILQKRLGIYK
jgi:hypothetical protein